MIRKKLTVTGESVSCWTKPDLLKEIIECGSDRASADADQLASMEVGELPSDGLISAVSRSCLLLTVARHRLGQAHA